MTSDEDLNDWVSVEGYIMVSSNLCRCRQLIIGSEQLTRARQLLKYATKSKSNGDI